MGTHYPGVPHDLVAWLRDAAGLTAFVETGTHKGTTAAWAAGLFPRVVTTEAYEPLYRLSLARHGHLPNVEFRLGDSPAVLREVVPTLTGPAVFWLDAHWSGPGTAGGAEASPGPAAGPVPDARARPGGEPGSGAATEEGSGSAAGECPLLAELAAVNAAAADAGHVVLIDDARLFLAPPPAPHDPTHWPDLRAVCDALGRHPSDRYVLVFRDVIVAVPSRLRSELIAYVRAAVEMATESVG
ncbi:MAG: hypothetical protein JWO31_134 [Phycisphaerales bacterium]|nr:hypothetical protein [Phycisphaerales bacterium]